MNDYATFFGLGTLSLAPTFLAPSLDQPIPDDSIEVTRVEQTTDLHALPTATGVGVDTSWYLPGPIAP